MDAARFLLVLGLLAQAGSGASDQSASLAAQTKQAPLTEAGQVAVAGRSMPYLIRHLPVNSFPDLPATVAEILNRRGCAIPQTYEARRPENVIHASFERAGSSDWAVLCSAEGTVSLLVFFDGGAEGGLQPPTVLASSPETQRLQAHPGSPMLGFNWGIDPASPQQVHDAQSGMRSRPGPVDHDAVADSVVDHNTIYHFYSKAHWSVLETAD